MAGWEGRTLFLWVPGCPGVTLGQNKGSGFVMCYVKSETPAATLGPVSPRCQVTGLASEVSLVENCQLPP